MTEQEKEFEKCKNDPYYFFTNYVTVNGKPVTHISREQFNDTFYGNLILKKTRSGDKFVSKVKNMYNSLWEDLKRSDDVEPTVCSKCGDPNLYIACPDHCYECYVKFEEKR